MSAHTEDDQREEAVERRDLFSRLCEWLDHVSKSEKELAEKLAKHNRYADAADSWRKAKIYEMVKAVAEETQSEINRENAKEQA